MNKIVRTHYPVEKLPEDLRPPLMEGEQVIVTIEAQSTPGMSATEWLNWLQERREVYPLASDDPVERIRKLRDEWED